VGSNHRHKHSFSAAVVLAASLVASSAAFAADPGITDDEILIGMSNPYSGPNASYGVIGSAIKACFDYYNAEEGGIQMGDGKRRKIALKVYDDAMEPARSLQNARRLVSQDKVFATVGNTGTGANLAVRKFYNQNKVPHLFIGSGGPMFGSKEDVENYPWSMLAWPAYNTEAAIYANYIKQNYPDAKIALLNDDSGGPFFADAFV